MFPELARSILWIPRDSPASPDPPWTHKTHNKKIQKSVFSEGWLLWRLLGRRHWAVRPFKPAQMDGKRSVFGCTIRRNGLDMFTEFCFLLLGNSQKDVCVCVFFVSVLCVLCVLALPFCVCSLCLPAVFFCFVLFLRPRTIYLGAPESLRSLRSLRSLARCVRLTILCVFFVSACCFWMLLRQGPDAFVMQSSSQNRPNKRSKIIPKSIPNQPKIDQKSSKNRS